MTVCFSHKWLLQSRYFKVTWQPVGSLNLLTPHSEAIFISNAIWHLIKCRSRSLLLQRWHKVCIFITVMKEKCFYRSVWRTGARLVELVFIMQIELSFCLSSISRSSSSSAQLSSSPCPPWRLLTLFKRVASVLLWCPFVGLWPISWPFPFPLIYVASRMDSTVLPNFVDCVIFDVMFTLLTRCVVGFEEKHSEFLLRPKRGKKLFSTWSCAFISFVLAHVNAFMNDFLKLSDKKLW